MKALREISATCVRGLVLASTFWLSASAAARPQCPAWADGFGLPGPDAGVNAAAMFDDGTGTSLFVGGSFTTVEGESASHVAKWDGTSWSTLGVGLDGAPLAMTVFDDGSGPALFVGGVFTTAGGVGTGGIARWDGTNWSALGPGVEGTVVALTVFDDGRGPALHAGGRFTVRGTFASARDPRLRNVAKWDGTSWSPLAKGTDGWVEALEVFNDGSGSMLYVGGTMKNAGDTGIPGLARWDGQAWSAIGGLTNGGGIFALRKHDDGSGAALYAAGQFSEIAGVPAANIARWNGAVWSSVGPGVAGVEDLAVFDDGSGATLHASVQSTVSRWDGAHWTPLPAWPPHPGYPRSISCLSTLHDGTRTALFVGMPWVNFFGGSGLHLVEWDGTDWRLVGREDGIPGGPNCLAVLDQGAGPRLVAGGAFRHAGSALVRNLSILEAGDWISLGGGTDGPVHALAVLPSGMSEGLVVAGDFTEAGGTSANSIALWQGAAWITLGQGVDDEVTALTVSDEGSGPILYAGGSFEVAGGAPAHHVARWDGAAWSALGAGVDGSIEEMVIFDSGTGPDLYVGGSLGISRWNGSAWSSLGSGVNGSVTALAVADDGSGNALYVAGGFTMAGGVGTFRIARWNGILWSTVGEVEAGFVSPPAVLVTFDDGSGPALFALGQSPDGDPALLWKWDGVDWAVQAFVLAKEIRGVTLFDDGSDGTPDLYAAGLVFQAAQAGVRPAAEGIARFDACPHAIMSLCFGGEPSFTCPCGNLGAPGRGCDNSAATGGAELRASGTASLRTDTLRLTSSGEPAGAPSLFLQGDARHRAGRGSFGDENRCVGGRLRRLDTRAARGGVVSTPEPSDPGLAGRSRSLGDPLTAGSVRYYQVLYRDASPDFCPPPLGSSWNLSNALAIGWLP